MFFILYLLQLFVLFGPDSEDHAIYLSTITVSVNDQDMDVIIKVFEDDLRDAVRNNLGYPPDTSSNVFKISVDQYLKAHFSLLGAGSEWKGEVAAVDRMGDSYHIRFTSAPIMEASQITIKADYFMELFPTQQNILDFRIEDRKVYHIFKKGATSKTIKISH